MCNGYATLVIYRDNVCYERTCRKANRPVLFVTDVIISLHFVRVKDGR